MAIDPHHYLLMVNDPRGFPESLIDVPPRMAKDFSQRVALGSYEYVFADPRSAVLEALELPKGARPVGYVNGKPMWGNTFGRLADPTT